MPHFDHIRSRVAELLELGEAARKVHAAAAEGDALEFSGEIVPHRERVLQMDGDDAAHAVGELIVDVVFGPRAEVAEVGVNAEPRRAEHALVSHILGDGVQKRRVHDLHREHDLPPLRLLDRPREPLAEPPHALRRGGLVVNVVAGELDDADSHRAGEIERAEHNVPRFVADSLVRAAEGEAPVGA